MNQTGAATPRTDALVCTYEGVSSFEYVDPEDVREIERELTASAAQVERMRKALEEAQEVLRQIQWAGGYGRRCPMCSEPNHAADCTLAAALEGLKS